MMIRALRCHRTALAPTLASILGVFSLLSSARLAHSVARSTCEDPAYRTFDFWVGDWDVYDNDQPGKKVAHAVVELILDRCVLHEIYEATDGHKGESFTIYDSSRRTWHQTWVTDHGQLLTIEGAPHDGAMVLAGADRTPDGKARRVRGSWKAETSGVREVAARSTDGGHRWEPWFDLTFRPHVR
jgi:hypothetical protein